jgi:uncharacterized protein YyaL (SSP411 family)
VFADDSLPAGNGIVAMALGRLGGLLGEPRYLVAAEKIIPIAWSGMSKAASSHTTMLLALEDYVFPPQLIILRGDPAQMKLWQAECHREYAPQRLCFAIPKEATDLPGRLAERQPQGEVVAYLCQGRQCDEPVTSLEELKRKLALGNG